MYRLTLLGAGAENYSAPEFNPISLGNLRAWYKADAGVTLNGSNVSQWNDQSGNANNLTQSTATDQPLFVASGLNGKPVLRYEVDEDSMYLPAIITGFGNMTYFAVVKQTFAGYYANLITDGVLMAMSSRYLNTARIGSNILADVQPEGVFILNAGNGTGSTANFYRNGANIGTVTGSSDFYQWRYIGVVGAAFIGDLAELLIFDRVLNSTDMALMNSYLNSKYLIY